MTEIRNFFVREWTGAEKTLLIACCILLGTVNGFLISPVKKGISFGNNNGNTYGVSGENTEPPAGKDRKYLPKPK